MNTKRLTFEQWAERNEDLLEDLGISLEDLGKVCDYCEGRGELKCDLGHYHDCEDCDGKGSDDQEGCAKLRKLYDERVRREDKLIKALEP